MDLCRLTPDEISLNQSRWYPPSKVSRKIQSDKLTESLNKILSHNQSLSFQERFFEGFPE